MMTIAINGFGRIGRNFLRAVLIDPKARAALKIAVINVGPARLDMVAHMFKYDTLMGPWKGTVTVENNYLIIDEYRIALCAIKDPAQLDWKSYGIDWVVDASGAFTHADKARLHIKAGAKKVLITAPAEGDDVSIVPGVNDAAYDPARDTIVSLGSCTTNAFLPMLKVMHESCGILSAIMTTVHAYTNSQVLLDVEAKDPRVARAAALNIIPTGTGASKMVANVLPELAHLVQAESLRVPVAKVSLIDLVLVVQKETSAQTVNDAFKKASQGALKGIVEYATEPLVSSDYSGSSASVIIDSLLTKTQGQMVQVFGWYDNEWGYSERLKDFLMSIK